MTKNEIVHGIEREIRRIRKEPKATMLGICITVDEAEEIVKLLKEQEALVRCKDCKSSGLDSSGINGYWCSAHTEWHDGNWFCADGERREYVKPTAESATDWDGVNCE